MQSPLAVFILFLNYTAFFWGAVCSYAADLPTPKNICSQNSPCHLEKAVHFLRRKKILSLKYSSTSANTIMGSESKTSGLLYVKDHSEFLITNQSAQETYYSPDAKKLYIKKTDQKFVLSDFRMSNTQEYMAFQIISGNSKVFNSDNVLSPSSRENICPKEKDLVSFFVLSKPKKSSNGSPEVLPLPAASEKKEPNPTLGDENSQGSYCIYVTSAYPVLIKKVSQKDDAENTTELQFIYEETPELYAILKQAYEQTGQKIKIPVVESYFHLSASTIPLESVKKGKIKRVKTKTVAAKNLANSAKVGKKISLKKKEKINKIELSQ